MTGRLERHDAFESAHVRSRTVDIWIPESADGGGGPYPLLIMHDGQNLFDASLSFSGVDWGVHHAMSRLVADGEISEAIIVGIWNTDARIAEYMPQRLLSGDDAADRRSRFEKTYGGLPISDAYLRFVTAELLPFVERTFRIDSEHRYMMGSSMGGLVSLYALCEYPDVFAGAGCLSTSWTIGGDAILAYMRRRLPAPLRHRIYFDFGAEAQIPRYFALQKEVNALMEASGYRHDADWVTRRFPGAPHSESAWRDRVHVPLRFLLAPRSCEAPA